MHFASRCFEAESVKFTENSQLNSSFNPIGGWRFSRMSAAPLQDFQPEAKVLVVDDETNIVELLSVSLKFQGFEVYTAANGPAALDRAREVRPDAVILDVMMPGMDGFGLLRRLRAAGIDR